MLKKILKTIIIIAAVVFIAIQFYRPEKNNSNEQSKHLSTLYPVPDSVETILKVACYDCHSNNTRYPWYAEIQPVGWWLNDHIQHAKRDLNFSIFASYRIRRQYRKLEEIRDPVDGNLMPLPSYTIMHRDAILTQQQKDLIFRWAGALRDSIEAHNSPDSLTTPQRR